MTNPSRNRSLAVVAAFVVAAVLLGACGTAQVEVTGKAKTLASDAASAALDTDVTIVDGTTQDTTGDTAPSTTRAVPAPTTAPAPTTPPAPVERSNEAYCAAAGKVLNSGLDSALNLDVPNPDAEAVKARFVEAMRTAERLIGDMERAAPSAIAADMKLVAEATSAAVDALDTAQGIGELFDSMAAMETREVAAASERVTAYTLEHCGFSLEASAR